MGVAGRVLRGKSVLVAAALMVVVLGRPVGKADYF